ncbi:MAG: Hsp70 family protein, partial [Clostridia bacterium]|nr:Hsp70 family protein [Clostridia bacterium]
QHISITASSNMSKEDIDKAVRDAEQYAAEDKARKEEVDLRNGADQVVFQSERILEDEGDKFEAADKDELQSAIDELKEALKGSDTNLIKTKQDALQAKFYEVSAKLYQANAPQGDPSATGFDPNAAAGFGGDPGFGGQAGPDDAADVDFTDVD